MRTVVAKFGGTSLADAGQFAKIRQIIAEDPDRRFIVASAPGKRFEGDVKVTDLLLRCYEAVVSGGDFEPCLQDVAARYADIAGALAPLIILGIIPAAVGIITGNALVFWIGLVMIFSAGGDFLIVMLILTRRSTASEALYLDHPTQAGVVVFERQL